MPDIPHSDFEVAREINQTAFKRDMFPLLDQVIGDINRSNPTAIRVNKEFNSEQTQKRIDEQVRFILKDEAFGAREYAGEFRDIIDDRLSDTNGTVFSTERYKNRHNRYLDQSEQVFIVISSSIPETTLKSYFADVADSLSAFDVKFILRGVVDNNISAITKTQQWIGKVTEAEKKGAYYGVIVDINPKISSKFGIDRAPAVLYIRNYNPAIEEPNGDTTGGDDQELYFIAYGASKLDYALTKINQEAKSEGVDRLITALQKRGFFNETPTVKETDTKSTKPITQGTDAKPIKPTKGVKNE